MGEANVICDGPFVPTKTIGDPAVTVPKTRKEFNDTDRKAIEKNFRAKQILVFGIGPDEYNRISTCQSAKEIFEALQIAYEGTTQVKLSNIDILTTEYELFRMKDDESIQDMHTRFTSIRNEIHSLGEIIPRNKLVRKILSVLPSSWESKVNDITGAKDLQKLTIDKLFGNLKTKYIADNIVKEALAAWGDSSSESDKDDDKGYSSMMAVESEATEYDSNFALMAQSDDDEDDADKGAVKGSSQQWYMDRVGRIGKSLSHSIENVYYVNELKYSLLSVSKICDNGNKVEFVSKICTVINLVTGEMVLVVKQYKNIYVTDFESLQNGDLSTLSAVDDDAELWHRRLGHTSFMLLNKLFKKDLVRGLPNSSFKNHKVHDACVKGKQFGSSSKDETFEVLVAFVKRIQVKMSHNVVSIRTDHGTEFDNATFDEFCVENGISHNLLAPRTPK
ncbi:uncharacterized protein LOC142167357 [Nicotiana tabacum]|uniref:Uncharacterized protein LOC142167357 n=1 Tax=Nicotiana tabacum TaxID=4097 RepID=A0AC58SF74_TOBAC